MAALSVLYEDSDVLLVVKPAGIATESRRMDRQDLVSMVRNYRLERGEDSYAGMIHRLDQPVGGLILFAKNKRAAATLSAQIQKKEVDKYYQALVCGEIPSQGVFEDYLLKDAGTNLSRVVTEKTPGAKKARLEFRKRKMIGPYSLVEIRLDTGRHHQIRVQMAHHGFPLVGDRKYNGEVAWEKGQELALFAWKLKFRHPATGKRMEFTKEPDFA